MPSKYDAIENTAIDLMNWSLIEINADDVKHKFSRPYLSKDHYMKDLFLLKL